jgi:DNA-binding transcriptional LysR family regulator
MLWTTRWAVLDFNDFFYFVQVVDRGGFTGAGRTLRIPQSTLSHRIQQLEANLGVRLLNRTSRRFGMTDAGEEFYRHAVVMLREAELAETAIRHRLNEPTGTVRCTAAVATMQFAMRDIVPDFLLRYPKLNVVAHATDQNVDIIGENYDVVIRAHSDPLPDSTLVQRTLTPAPWLLFAGSAYLNAREAPQTPKDLQSHPSLFMMRTGVTPVWRLRHANKAKAEVVMRLTPRLLSDDMIGLKQAAIAEPICFSPYLYRARNLVERFFNKIKHCRRVATRYDKLAANYLAFVQLASIRLWLRVNESTT